MKYRSIIAIIGSLVITIFLVWAWLRKSPELTHDETRVRWTSVTPSSPSPSNNAITPKKSAPQSAPNAEIHRKERIAKIAGALATPITFYGKIIDQNGTPVSGADVDYGTIDKFDESGSNYQSKSDENGSFSISGIKGAVLTVGVRKEGYYNIHGKSDSAFAYAVGVDPTRKAPPTKDNPAVFVLQKQGTAEPLIRVGGGQIDVPRTGQPLNIDFASGKVGRGDLQVQTWVGDSAKERFDWSYQLSIPGGGLVEKTGQFDFEAPGDGYQPALGDHILGSAQTWSARPEKEYFAKLPDGRYARFAIHFYAGTRNFVVFTSYLNPAVGHRNLEFDPAKQLKVK